MANASRSRDCSRRRHSRELIEGATNWRGHDDVMQIRSFRGSGEPAWVIALPSACKRLGPDPRRALGPAAIRAASTGRTRDRTRPMLHKRQKVLARAPSTRDPDRKRGMRRSVARPSSRCPVPIVRPRRDFARIYFQRFIQIGQLVRGT
jgi:hypothetical protein